MAIKIAFTYISKSIEVTKYEYGDCYLAVLKHIKAVRETLLIKDVDPDEISDEIPQTTRRTQAIKTIVNTVSSNLYLTI